MATKRARRSDRRDDGAVALEFALILPVLVMLLIGTVTTAISYAHVLGLTNAVREGARFGATADASTPSWASDVATRVGGTQFDDPGHSTTICVELYKQGGGGGVSASCPANGGPSIASSDYPPVPALATGQCVVRVVAARRFTINLVIFGTVSQSMTRGSVARYEGESC